MTATLQTMSGTKAVKNHPGVYTYYVKLGPPNKRLRYAAVATVQGRQRWTRGHLTIKAAEDARDALRDDMKGGATKADARQRLADYMTSDWLPTVDVSPGSLRVYKGDVARIAKFIGDVKVSQLNIQQVKKLSMALREAKYAANTRSRTLVTLSAVIKAARIDRKLASNPLELVDRPKRQKRKGPTVVADDIERLLQSALAESLRPKSLVDCNEVIVWLAMDTTLREERELFSAAWSGFDPIRGVLRVADSKTESGVRAVRLGPRSIEILQQHRVAQIKRFKDKGSAPPKLIFVDKQGKALTQSNYFETWDRIRKDAGLADLHFHDLRHVAATVMARMGIHPKVAQARLGHAYAGFSLDVYTSEVPEGQEEAAYALERYLAMPRVTYDDTGDESSA